jgi:Flp pilus assembly protein TadB
MTAFAAGVGLVGMWIGLRAQRPSLQGFLADLTAEKRAIGRPEQASSFADAWRMDRRMALRLANSVREQGWFERELGFRLVLADTSLEELSARVLICTTIGFSFPVLTWLIMIAGGVHVRVLFPIVAGLVLASGGALLPIAEMNAQAKRGRRHAKRVICSFLDLVVLGLAGGMGIESALLTAAQLGENVMSRRLVTALSLSRDTGEPPWDALARLGRSLDIEELSELAAAAGLAGVEGAKVRGTLAARAASIRRHELANSEAEANALTEKLFIPGTFLLVGFLIFVGYPAFTRIASGF